MSRVPRSPRQPPRSDRWQAWWMAAHSEHTPLGAREEKGRRGGGRWNKQGAAGGRRGSQIAGDAEDTKGENDVVMSAESKCLLQVHDWHGWGEFTGRCLWGRAALQVETSLLVEVNPPQPGYRPLNHRPRPHICCSEPIGGINVGSEHFCGNKLISWASGTKTTWFRKRRLGLKYLDSSSLFWISVSLFPVLFCWVNPHVCPVSRCVLLHSLPVCPFHPN